MLIILEIEFCRDRAQKALSSVLVAFERVKWRFILCCQNSHNSALGWQEHPAGHLRTVIFWLKCTENILLGSFSSPLEIAPCALTKMHCHSPHRLLER